MAVSTKVIVIAVVAVVAVAGIGVAVYSMSKNGSNDVKNYNTIDVSSSLAVYGNANGDASINTYDVELLEEIIIGEKNMSDYPLADADLDGEITNADVNIVKKLIKHEKCKINIIALDRLKNQINVAVEYPVENAVSFSTNMNAAILYSGGIDKVAGFFRSGYDNFDAPLRAVATSLGDNPNAGWANFTKLASEKKIGAFFGDISKISQLNSLKSKDLEDAGIPQILLPVTDAKDEISATLLIGFLLGEESEKKSQEYAVASWAIIKEIEDKIKDIASKKTAIAITMGSSVCGHSSENYDGIKEAGGTPYWEVNSAFKAAFPSTTSITAGETLAPYDDADFMISVRTVDTKSADLSKVMMDTWEKYDEYFDDLDNYHSLYYINNILPGAIKLAYEFEEMYPTIAGKGYGDSVFAKIALVSPQLEGCTVENTFTDMTYDDYVALKAAA